MPGLGGSRALAVLFGGARGGPALGWMDINALWAVRSVWVRGYAYQGDAGSTHRDGRTGQMLPACHVKSTSAREQKVSGSPAPAC